MNSSPEIPESIKRIVEEGISAVPGDTNICLFSFGNTLNESSNQNEVKARNFDSSKMFEGSHTGISNLYLALLKLKVIIDNSDLKENLIMIICSCCGASDHYNILDSEAKNYYSNSIHNILIYGHPRFHIPVKGVSINTDLIFTAGNEKDAENFRFRLSKLVTEMAQKSEPHSKTSDGISEKQQEPIKVNNNLGVNPIDPDDPFA